MNKYLGLAVASLAVMAAAQASAATVTQTFYTGASPFTTAPAQNQNFPFTNNIAVNTFDTTSGATLNSVTIAVNGNITVAARVSNNGTSGQTEAFEDASASAPVTIQIISAGSTIGVVNQTFSSGLGSGSVAPNQTVTAVSSVSPFNTSNSVGIAPFVGNGTTPVTLRFRGGPLSASGIGVDNVTFFGGTALANATLSVTYDFTEAPPPPPPVEPPPVGVPEPASLALLGLGLAALGMVRRRA